MVALIGPFLLATAPLALAQHGAGKHYPAAGQDVRATNSERAEKMRATDDQRLAFGECAKVGESVRKIIDRMVGPGTRWRYDDKLFPIQKDRLQIAFGEMAFAHRQFRETLSDAQARELGERLAHLERVQDGIDQWMVRLNEEVAGKNMDSRRVYADAHKLKELADRWRSEHRKLAKEMSITHREMTGS